MNLPLNVFLALGGVALVFSALILLVTRNRVLSITVKIAIVLTSLFLLLLPVMSEPLVIYLRGFTGDFSVAMLLLSASTIASIFVQKDFITTQDKKLFYLMITLMSLILYPPSLGWGSIDTYQIGYSFWPIEWILVALGLLAFSLRAPLTVVWIATALISYQLSLFESRNLWDYLIDPIVSVIAISSSIVGLFRKKKVMSYAT